jgi:hypothetical protein
MMMEIGLILSSNKAECFKLGDLTVPLIVASIIAIYNNYKMKNG